MAATENENPGGIRRLWRGFIEQWIATVPDDLAGCEFECRESRCSMSEWDQCPHRLDAMVRGRAGMDSAG